MLFNLVIITFKVYLYSILPVYLGTALNFQRLGGSSSYAQIDDVTECLHSGRYAVDWLPLFEMDKWTQYAQITNWRTKLC